MAGASRRSPSDLQPGAGATDLVDAVQLQVEEFADAQPDGSGQKGVGLALRSGWIGDDIEVEQHRVRAHKLSPVVPPALPRRRFPGPARVGERLRSPMLSCSSGRPVWINSRPTDWDAARFAWIWVNPTATAVSQNRPMPASVDVPQISRQKLGSLRDTSQSQPGRSHPRTIKNISSDIVEGGNTNRAASDWSDQACGLSQRSRNVRAAQSDAGFPRPAAT